MKKFNGLPPVSRAHKGDAEKWRVSFQFLPDGLPDEKEQTNVEYYPTLTAARWAYRATLRAAQNCRHLVRYRIALNKACLAIGEKAEYQTSWKREEKLPKREWRIRD